MRARHKPWVVLLRGFGVIAGTALMVLGAWTFMATVEATREDPRIQNVGWAYLADLSVIVPGALLVAPWSRIRPRALWYTLFVALAVVTPPAALFLFALNTWSRMHGVGEALDATVTLLLVGWASQLPAIWTLRPRDVASEPEPVT